jgi:hypothetical protein
MQLSFCIALPPYSYLRAGKLVAALAASAEVSHEHHRRYGNPLRAVITIAARGLHSPIFNRIMVMPGGLYRRIGQTSGYSALIFRKETLAKAKQLIQARDGQCSQTTDRPIRALKRALNICDLPRERLVRMAFPKGVYVACHRSNVGGLTEHKHWPSAVELIEYWKARDLTKAVRNDRLMELVREFECIGSISQFANFLHSSQFLDDNDSGCKPVKK